MNRPHVLLIACWAIIVGVLLFTFAMAVEVAATLHTLAKLLFVW